MVLLKMINLLSSIVNILFNWLERKSNEKEKDNNFIAKNELIWTIFI